MNLKGTYVFKQNGLEVGRSENLVTKNGTTAILKYLTNSSVEWASALSVGAIATTPTVLDTTLAYEIARSAVTMKSYIPGSPNLIVIKGTLSSSISANIYEIGLYPYNTSQVLGIRDQLIIDDFSNLNNWLIGTTPLSSSSSYYNAYAPQSPYSPRVGLYSAIIPAATTVSNTSISANLGSYTTLDTLDILVNVASGKSGTLNVTLTDVNGVSANVLSYPFAYTGGYQILSLNLPSNITSLSTINKITLSTVGTNSQITVDAIRVSVSAEISSSIALISRSVLTTPIAKIYGTPLDIEYYLQLN
jgi:hypothetical protein